MFELIFCTAVAAVVGGTFWHYIHAASDHLARKVWPDPAPNPAERVDMPAPTLP